ncbi:hypothetical protein GY45DRAFT_1439593 [Cubamyces sp. BRFM 1775]|nr:hypothetical protein GY45DRAFT_1439593 [Cubamyces sp. BRFM 1775]
MTTAEEKSQSHTTTDFNVLPVELIDRVFQYASEDLDTASACTLVSQSWRELALPHLFSWLTVARRTTFEDFRDFLDTHPHIARCIRTLELAQLSDCTTRSTLWVVSLDSLIELVAKLPVLRVLLLRGIFFLDPPPRDAFESTLTTPAALHKRLEHLEIHGCFDHVVSDALLIELPTLTGILQAFPANSITLSSVNVPTPGPRTTSILDPSTRLHVRELLLDGVDCKRQPNYDMAHLLTALREVLAPGCLQSFLSRVGLDTRPDPGSMGAFGELVHSTAETLQHLGLPFALRHLIKASEDKPEHWRRLNLHECHNLQSFTLPIYPPMLRTFASARGSPYRQDVPLSTTCIAILSHLPQTLRTFTLAICNEVAPAHIKSAKMGLEALDGALLEKGRFPALELVEVTLRQLYHPEASLDGCERAVREVMPKCDGRGILEVLKDVSEDD